MKSPWGLYLGVGNGNGGGGGPDLRPQAPLQIFTYLAGIILKILISNTCIQIRIIFLIC